MPKQSPHHRACARCLVRIDVHGSKDRAKDASPEHMRRSLVRVTGAYAWWRMRDGVPLLGVLRASAVAGAPRIAGGPHNTRRTDLGLRSATVPRRTTSSRRPGCLGPPRHAKELYAEGSLPPAFAPALSLTPPARPHRGGGCFEWALQGHGAVTRESVNLESTDAFTTLWNLRAWD